MKTVTQTLELSNRYSTVRALGMIAETGFDGADLSLVGMCREGTDISSSGIMSYAEQILNACAVLELPILQCHAPFAFGDYGRENLEKVILPTLAASLRIAGAVGAPYCVVHPIHNLPYPESRELLREQNLEFYHRLLPYAREYGVCIAVENMWKRNKQTGVIGNDVCSCPEEFVQYVDMMDSEHVCACLDIGHVGLCSQSLEAMINGLGKRIKCIHLHDNDGKEDLHTLMGKGCIDFDHVARLLAKIGYNGNITLEADGFLENASEEQLPYRLALMGEGARRFRSRVLEYKSTLV